jgi:phosphoglycolate phosphatase-like HAD superfamily hydrolase
MSEPAGIAIDLDGALADTRRLWRDWLTAAAPVLGVEVDTLPEDRVEAAAELDRSGAGNWRTLLARFGEERAPVYVRRDAWASAALRVLAASGRPLAVFTDAPEELASVVLAQLGADRRVSVVIAGERARERALAKLGPNAVLAPTRHDLERMAREGT